MPKFNFDKWLSRGTGFATLWPLLPPTLVAIVLAWASQGIAWISQYGTFGWLVTALIGFLLTTLGMYGIAKVRERLAYATATRRWSREVTAINPLAAEFSRERIYVPDLVHPLNPVVNKRRFTDCEIIGRANLLLAGHGYIRDSGFSDCDFVIINQDKEVPINNAVIFADCGFIGCEFVRCTFYLHQQLYEKSIKPLGAEPISYERPAQ